MSTSSSSHPQSLLKGRERLDSAGGRGKKQMPSPSLNQNGAFPPGQPVPHRFTRSEPALRARRAEETCQTFHGKIPGWGRRGGWGEPPPQVPAAAGREDPGGGGKKQDRRRAAASSSCPGDPRLHFIRFALKRGRGGPTCGRGRRGCHGGAAPGGRSIPCRQGRGGEGSGGRPLLPGPRLLPT